jgi:hypothetical protein
MLSAKERKKQKSRVERILRIQGLDYDEWIDIKHKEILVEQEDFLDSLIDKALDSEIEARQKEGSNTDSSNDSY